MQSGRKNLVQFDEMHFRLEPSSVVSTTLRVEEGHLTGVQFDTDRSDDGQLEMVDEPVSEEPSWISDKLTELAMTGSRI